MRNPFRIPDKRDKFNSAIKAWRQKHSILFYADGVTPCRGNAVSEMFWRGYRGQVMGNSWDPVSRDSLSYIWFRAGQAARKEVDNSAR